MRSPSSIPGIGLIVVREQRSDLEDWVDGIEIHAVLSPEASDSTTEALLDRLDGWLTASGRLAGDGRRRNSMTTRQRTPIRRPRPRLTCRFESEAIARRGARRARGGSRARARSGAGAESNQSGCFRRSTRTCAPRSSSWPRRKAVRERRRPRSTSRPGLRRSSRTRWCSSTPTCSSATSRTRSSSSSAVLAGRCRACRQRRGRAQGAARPP